jgi:thioredoxin reductase
MYKPVKPLKNIIIGAGPAGVQLGYFFQNAGIEYVILEKSEMAGSFFDRYPHSGQLISINKPNTGSDIPDFNLRHDWNSLISEGGPKFTDYSKDYYPESKDLTRYINDFAKHFKLNIKYGHKVEKIRKREDGYIISVVEPGGNWLYSCEKLIVATGIGLPNRNDIDDKTNSIKHYAEYEKGYFKKAENLEKFKNKSVLLVGNGNSAYELANLLTPLSSSVVILGKDTKPWAMSTHYAGDLRSVYLPFYDTFLLKSLNAFDITHGKQIITQNTTTSKYNLHTDCGRCPKEHVYHVASKNGYDHIILCTGWRFDKSIFDFEIGLTPAGKYPHITPKYESVNNKNLFFIGSLMHSLDYKKSSGGFIHGFRYLIKYFFNTNYDGKIDIMKFSSKSLNTIVNHIIYKINYTSALYQMYGQLADVCVYNPEKSELMYINDIYYISMGQNKPNPALTYFVITLEYSNAHPEKDYSKLGTRLTSIGSECKASLLHPVIRVLKDTPEINKALIEEVHFDEDLLANFTGKDKYIDKLTRVLKMFIS